MKWLAPSGHEVDITVCGHADVREGGALDPLAGHAWPCPGGERCWCAMKAYARREAVLALDDEKGADDDD